MIDALDEEIDDAEDGRRDLMEDQDARRVHDCRSPEGCRDPFCVGCNPSSPIDEEDDEA